MSKTSLDSIENYKQSFSKSDQKIYDAIKKNWENINTLSIGAIATEADVSWSSISKFFKKYGFDGWKGFKQAAFVLGSHSPRNTEIQMAAALQEELSKPIILRGLMETSKAILKRKVIIVGSNHGESLARDFSYKCRLININIEFANYGSFDTHVTGNEWFIFVSLSGKRSSQIDQFIKYVETSTNKKVSATYISSSPLLIDNQAIKYSLHPGKINFSWKYEELIPRISLFGTALILDKLFEITFDSNKDRNLKLLEIIKKNN